MKVPVKWLKDYVNIALPVVEIAGRLTMAGLEVKGTQTTGNWENVFVGEIVAVDPHPNADRLRLATVNLGTGQETVVCGAPNLRVGDRIAFARVGAELIDGKTGQKLRLKPAKIRGVDSSGMICSEKELGISDSHEGIMVLPAEAPPGTALGDYLGDVVLDLEVTPNRPDCLSVIGIAREIAALTGQKTHIAEAGYKETAPPIEERVAVEIAATDLCSRYCASLITGVKIGESPDWVQQRLLACGMRPINNVVDATNYVMLEYGQPLHAFDYDKITGKKIIVRRAADGEHIVSLDGVERALSRDILVIADTGRAVAIAGVMGGAASEVTGETASILLESASFKPTSIYYTSRALALTSEASMRFERGIRAELTLPALKRATQLIIQLAGGEAASGVIDSYPGRRERKPVLLSIQEVKRILGVDFSVGQIVETLTSLGIDCEVSALDISATPPYWRGDINLPVDLVEEVARIAGYDRIPMTMLSQAIPKQEPNRMLGLKKKVGYCLAGYGFQEIVTYSLVGLELLNKLLPESHALEPAPLRVANPMTAEQEYLRPNLRAGLLNALALNLKHEEDGIRLFELGKVFLPRPGDLPAEPEIVCGILSGPREESSWRSENRAFDFYDAKGIAEGLLRHLGLEPIFEKCQDESLHPGKQAAIIVSNTTVGVVGELHPRVSLAFEFPAPVYLFEVNLTALLPFTDGCRMFQPLPRFPAVVRDIALVVDSKVTHQQVADVIKGFSLVSRVRLFDVYSGGQVPAGKKSLAYRITFQLPDHTLTDDDANKVQRQILNRLSRELGATLRS